MLSTVLEEVLGEVICDTMIPKAEGYIYIFMNMLALFQRNRQSIYVARGEIVSRLSVLLS